MRMINERQKVEGVDFLSWVLVPFLLLCFIYLLLIDFLHWKNMGS